MREYLRNNTNARIASNIRSRLNKALNGKQKQQSTKKLIGIDYELYLQWMQFQLPEGYSMDDIGKKLHIDHARPLSSYDLTVPQQLEEACSWKNLAPIPANENLSKGDRIDEAATKKQQMKVEEFLAIINHEAESIMVNMIQQLVI
jgi:hypothetical protein